MIHAIIQARVSSTRLPGKVFMNLANRPLLWHVVNRLKPSKYLNDIIIASTTNSADLKIKQWCEMENIPCYLGSEDDVLDRYYQCAQKFKSEIIVRITADDPFKDYNLLDDVVEKLITEKLDFVYNNNPPTYPEGLDIEAFTFSSLQLAALRAKDPFEREHMTQYLHRNPLLFKSANIKNTEDLSMLRWTIDTQEDFAMATEVYSELYRENEPPFLTKNILTLLQKKPEIVRINSKVPRSFMYKKNT